MKNPLLRPVLVLVIALALLLPASPLWAQSEPATQYTVGDCARVDKQLLRAEIEALVLATLADASEPWDVDGLVSRKWAELNVDATINAEVQRAVDQLANDQNYLDKLISGWWTEKAQEFAETIAADAFSSPAMQEKLIEVATAIGTEVARQVEAQFAQAASVALLCLQAYVGDNYSTTLFGAFQDQVQSEVAGVDLVDPNLPAVDPVAQHSLALTGVGTIIVTQLIGKLAQKLSEKIAQRVTGKIAGRVLGRAGSSLIPAIGWVIGVGLIVYDLWEGGQGALPQIQEALSSEEVKQRIRDDIADAVRDDLPDQAALIALETSVSLVEEWQGFCDRYTYVCMVSDSNENFRSLLQLVTIDELPALAGLVQFYIDVMGRSALDSALAAGELEALLALPPSMLTVLQSTGNPQTVLNWAALAGDQWTTLVDYAVFAAATPNEFTRETLAALLALEGAAAAKLMAVPAEKRSVLLALPPDVLAKLAAVEPVADLDWLAGYLLIPQTNQGAVVEQIEQPEMRIDEIRQQATVTPDPTATATAAPAAVPTEGAGDANAALPWVAGIGAGVVVLALAGWWVWRRRQKVA